MQRVEENTYEVIQLLAERGGWEDGIPKGRTKPSKRPQEKHGQGQNESAAIVDGSDQVQPDKRGRKRKATNDDGPSETIPLRRSTRARK